MQLDDVLVVERLHEVDLALDLLLHLLQGQLPLVEDLDGHLRAGGGEQAPALAARDARQSARWRRMSARARARTFSPVSGFVPSLTFPNAPEPNVLPNS